MTDRLQAVPHPTPCTRRDILKAGALSAGGLLAAGCAATTGAGRAAPRPARAVGLRRDFDAIPEVDALRITVLIDCSAEDGLSSAAKACKVTRPGKPRATRIAKGRHLVSEYGVSLLLESKRQDATHTVLYDFGLSDRVLLSNLDLLDVDIGAIDTMVLSHGHADHYGGLEGFLRRHRNDMHADVRLLVGNGKAFGNRWKQAGTRRKSQGQLQRAAIERLGLQVEECHGATLLGEQGMVTGVIPMSYRHEKVSTSSKLHWQGAEVADSFEEELGLVYNVAGKGLVVLTGCGHRGVINTVSHAVQASGVKRVHAVIGGLHLGKQSEQAFQDSATALAGFAPQLVLPMHCTTTRAAHKLAGTFGDRVVFSSTGSVFEFA